MNRLTRHQAAEILGVCDQTVSNYCKEGLLGSWKGKGNKLYVNSYDVEKYKNQLKMIYANELLIKSKQRELDDMRRKLSAEEIELRKVITCEHRHNFGRGLSGLVKNLFRSFIVPYTSERDVIVICEFVDGHSLTEIADKLGISVERCRQLLVRSMKHFDDFIKIHERWKDYRETIEENESLRKEIEMLKKRYEPEPVNEEDRIYISNLLSVNIADLNVSVRVLRAIESSGWGVVTVGDLVKHSRLSLLSLRNFGEKCLREVDGLVNELCLCFMHQGESEGAFLKRMIDKQKERRSKNQHKTKQEDLSSVYRSQDENGILHFRYSERYLLPYPDG